MQQINLFLISICLLFSPIKIFSQERLTEAKLIGLWKMEIDIEKNSSQKSVAEKNIIEDALTEGLIGFTKVIAGNLDLRFNFKPGGKLEVTTRYGSEKAESSIGTWVIDKSGHLKINGDSKDLNDQKDDDCWVLRKGVLFQQKDAGAILLGGRMTMIK
ncbi:MAG: hypothetical protein ACO3FI_07480 [Cyclobacteriaceae bacterium]